MCAAPTQRSSVGPRPKARKGVLIVDDHPVFRSGLAHLIGGEADLRVSGEAGDGAQALAALERELPALVLVDISLPGRNGLELLKDLQAVAPTIPVLVLSMHDEALYAERVLRAGGRGYIMKTEGGTRLLEAMRHVLGGRIYVSEKMAARFLEGVSGRRRDPGGSPLEQLTDKEFEVLQLLGQGKGTREVARQLHVSMKTIEVHRGHIKEKLGLKSAPELMRFAVRWTESGGGS